MLRWSAGPEKYSSRSSSDSTAASSALNTLTVWAPPGVVVDIAAVQSLRQLDEARQLEQRVPRQVVGEQERSEVEMAAEGIRIDFETTAGGVHGLTKQHGLRWGLKLA